MAKATKVDRLTVEQLKAFSPEERVERLLPSINGLIDGSGFLNKQLTLGDNMAAKVFTIDVDMPDSEWIEVPDSQLQNGWIYYQFDEAVPAYRKDSFGIVHLRGIVKNGTVNYVPCLTLPLAYRPPYNVHIATVSLAAFGSLQIYPASGDLCIPSGSNVWVSLRGSFEAADRTPIAPDCFPLYQKWDLASPPTLCWIGAVRDREDNSELALSPMSLQWEYVTKDGSGAIKINNVTGLQYGRKYAISLVGLVG